MRHQKKIQHFKYLVIGLFIVCSLLLLWTFIKLNHLPAAASLLHIVDAALLVYVLLAVLTVWLLSSLVDEVVQRRTDAHQLYFSEAAVKASLNAVMITDKNRKIAFVNPALEEITGFQAEQIVGQSADMLLARDKEQDFYRKIWKKVRHNGSWQGEVWSRKQSGDVYLQLLNIVKFSSGLFYAGQYLFMFTDITQRKREQGEQAFLATHDELTRLPNRTLFYERVQQEMQRCTDSQTHLVMLFVDLDEFKQINDTYGHVVGDQMLVEVGNQLLKSVRQTDMVCRYGGDEFIVLLTNVEDDSAWELMADNLLGHICQPYQIDGETIHLSASIGIAIHYYHSPHKTISELINMADTAMYSAKVAGKNGYSLATDS